MIPDLIAAEKGGREIDRVGEREQHAVLHRQAHRLETGAEAVHALGELAERYIDPCRPKNASLLARPAERLRSIKSYAAL